MVHAHPTSQRFVTQTKQNEHCRFETPRAEQDDSLINASSPLRPPSIPPSRLQSVKNRIDHLHRLPDPHWRWNCRRQLQLQMPFVPVCLASRLTNALQQYVWE
jgi:hypothetical protein